MGKLILKPLTGSRKTLTKLRNHGFAIGSLMVLILMSIPAATAQSAGEPFEVTDPAGDTIPLNPTIPAEVVSSPLHDLADLVAIRILDETGVEVFVEVEVGTLTLDAPSARPVSISFVSCFQVASTDLGISITYSVPGDGQGPLFGSAWLLKLSSSDCVTGQGSAAADRAGVDVVFDEDRNVIAFRVPKSAVLTMLGPGPMVHPGDQLTGIRAMMQGTYSTPANTWYDIMQEKSDAYGFKEFFSNQHLKVTVSDNVRSLKGMSCSQFDRPVIGVPAGTYQAVPVVVHNDNPSPSTVSLLASSQDGDWNVGVIPQVTVPAAAGEEMDGRQNVTLIIKAPESSEKSCTYISLVANDPASQMRRGELVLEVVSVPMVTTSHQTLFWHAHARYQDMRNAVPYLLWMNAADNDPDSDPNFERRMVPPGPSTQVGSSSVVTMHGTMDVALPADILLKAGDAAPVTVTLRSEPVPTLAHFSFALLAGGTQVAAGETTAEIGTTETSVEIPVIVEPDAWKRPTRRVASGELMTFSLRYEPLFQNQDVPVPPGVQGQGSGYVYLNADQSSITLPVHSVVRTQTSTLGTEGGLLGLFMNDEERIQQVAPGRTAIFNFTVTNEGIEADSPEVLVNLTAEPSDINWIVTLLDHDRLSEMQPGEARRFSVAVTAPADAPPAATASVSVSVHSTRDNAAAGDVVTAEVDPRGSSGVQFEIPNTDAANGTPSPSAIYLVLAALGVAFSSRRSRSLRR